LNNDSIEVYPVYILSRVAKEIFLECKKAIPKETLGRLLGYRMQWKEKNYIKIVDWISGSLETVMYMLVLQHKEAVNANAFWTKIF